MKTTSEIMSNEKIALTPPESSADDLGGLSIDEQLLNNIPVSISVEVGRASLKIKDIMRLSQGAVIELERLAGEPLDLLVNNTLVAQGEVVLVNDRYGIRLTQVVPPADRLKKMKS
jgi:flagellar motor switch protein FliN/FliY